MRASSDEAEEDEEALQQLLSVAAAKRALLEKENALLHNYLTRVQSTPHSAVGEEASGGPQGGPVLLSATMTPPAALQELQASELNVIVGREVEALQAELADMRQREALEQAKCEALLEAAAASEEETQRELVEFKRGVVLGLGSTAHTGGQAQGERVLQYLERRLRGKDATLEKLALASKALKAQLRKSDSTVKHGDSTREALHAVDFDYLKIETKQLLNQIKARNKELMRLKVRTVHNVQVLSEQTSTLRAVAAEGAKLEGDLVASEADAANFDAVLRAVVMQRRAAEKSWQLTQSQLTDREQPDALALISASAEVQDLSTKAGLLQRKLESVRAEAHHLAEASRAAERETAQALSLKQLS